MSRLPRSTKSLGEVWKSGMPGVLAAEVPAVMGNGDVFETGAEIIGAAYSNLADMVAA